MIDIGKQWVTTGQFNYTGAIGFRRSDRPQHDLLVQLYTLRDLGGTRIIVILM